MADKPHINLVFIGHIDHGKSTLIGRFMLETGHVDQRVIDKFKEEAKNIGKESYQYAWVIDKLGEERKRGITIDVAWDKMETQHRKITIIDAPGHRDFLKNMITGANDADAAVLVVDAREGVKEQTREHIFLARTLGVDQMIVAVNKMDRVDYSKEIYEQRKEELQKIIKSVGYNIEKVKFVPLSAIEGDNIVKKSEKMKWYNGEPLERAIDSLEEPKKPVDKPLRLPIDKVYAIKGVGLVPIGRIETGVINVNDKIIFMPANKTSEVKSIEMHHEKVEHAYPGDNIGFNIKGLSKNDIDRGNVCGPVDNPPSVATQKNTIEAKVVVLNHPKGLSIGHIPSLFCHTASVPVTIVEIKSRINPATGQEDIKNPPILKNGESGVVVMQPLKPLAIEKASDIPELSRFALREGGSTIAAGICVDIS
ncbi:MAG: translation elongation factor EF-1 subunit alpha [Candidatus Nanoarchaeia archaeon]|nr:translation elongation factor EF-1 subunit alpha [Candidatus Nanoarchaeia archaeon]